MARSEEAPVEYVPMADGTKMPVLGFGTMRVKNLPELIPQVIEAGYRLIDTAANYDNEREVGGGIRRAISEGLVRREALFVTSKMQILTDGAKNTERVVESSLENLGLDYLDLYLIHQPYGDLYGEWRELERLQAQGKIRGIGVSNFEPFRLMDLMLHNEVSPAVNQIEVNPWYQEEPARAFDEQNGIVTEAWSPLAENKDNLFDNEALKGIAAAHGKTVQQVILRWVTQRGIVAIPRTSSARHAAENIDIFDFSLTDEEMGAIKALDTGRTTALDHLDPEVVRLLSTVVANPIEVGDKRPSHDEWAAQRGLK